MKEMGVNTLRIYYQTYMKIGQGILGKNVSRLWV